MGRFKKFKIIHRDDFSPKSGEIEQHDMVKVIAKYSKQKGCVGVVMQAMETDGVRSYYVSNYVGWAGNLKFCGNYKDGQVELYKKAFMVACEGTGLAIGGWR